MEENRVKKIVGYYIIEDVKTSKQTGISGFPTRAMAENFAIVAGWKNAKIMPIFED